MISADACQSTKTTELVKHQLSEDRIREEQINEEEIREELYHKDGIEGSFPSFVTSDTEDVRNLWNDIIAADFNKILQIYSFNPFPELTPSPTAVEPTILKITNEIKLNNQRAISIFYLAAFRSRYSAHPTDLAYTTNIDKVKNQRLKLSDIVTLNSDFVKNFREWNFVSEEERNEELNKAIRDYISNMSDEDLLMGFLAADQIGSGNLWGMYSYLTPERLGISVSVPNYIGDHVEFERDYSELGDFLTKDFKLQ
jgi:hypothetical protein